MKELDNTSLARRDFLKVLFISALFGLTGVGCNHQLDEQKLIKEVKKEMQFFKDRYGVAVHTESLTYDEDQEGISGDILPLNESKNTLAILRREMVKYPEEFITRYCGLKKIRILANLRSLTNRNRLIDGLSGGFWQREIYVGEMYVGIPQYAQSGRFDISRCSASFHHELFHIADYRDDKAINEDLAETAGLLMSKPRETLALITKDKRLRQQVEICKQFYFTWTRGKMNKRYWQDSVKGKVDRAYWREREM